MTNYEKVYFAIHIWAKSLVKTIDVISRIHATTGHQFHQHVYVQLFWSKNKRLLVFENKFHHAFSYENCVGCAIWKSHLAVLVAIPESQLAVLKKASKSCVKMLMELQPGVNLTNILWAAFLYESFLGSFCVLTIWVFKFLAKGF
jgi:hypothetical protein